ncbi:hypothetical protein T09_5106 [Trichinella sp. T9]|nr:hypothetical protein T09_5106 [Trichinella sp. T9]
MRAGQSMTGTQISEPYQSKTELHVASKTELDGLGRSKIS